MPGDLFFSVTLRKDPEMIGVDPVANGLTRGKQFQSAEGQHAAIPVPACQQGRQTDKLSVVMKQANAESPAVQSAKDMPPRQQPFGRLHQLLPITARMQSRPLRSYALGRVRIMLLPSLWEGLPVSVLEAMHRGIPVVASAIRGTDEVVADGDTGFLVPAGDVSAYADRIRRLLTNGELRIRMGVRALARARAAFSTAGQVGAHIALYARTVERVPS